MSCKKFWRLTQTQQLSVSANTASSPTSEELYSQTFYHPFGQIQFKNIQDRFQMLED